MTDVQPNQFVDRATAELEKLVSEARDGARSAEELVAGSIENLQQMVEDLVDWVASEIDKVRTQADEQRSKLETQLGDLLGSVAALVAGAVIVYTGWTPIDPLLSLLICLLVLGSSLRLLREVLQALLEGVPAHLSLEQIGQALAAVNGVRSVHDLHIWTLSSNRIALSAHLVVDEFSQWPQILTGAQHVLLHQGIAHVTLQPESAVHPVRWMSRAAEDAAIPAQEIE